MSRRGDAREDVGPRRRCALSIAVPTLTVTLGGFDFLAAGLLGLGLLMTLGGRAALGHVTGSRGLAVTYSPRASLKDSTIFLAVSTFGWST